MTDPAPCNVADQVGDPDSVFSFTKRVIAARRSSEDIGLGAYATLPAPEGVWAFRRGEATVVAVNLSDTEATVDAVGGRVLVSTDRAHEGAVVEGSLTLAPWSGSIVGT
jgi:glycosidase